MVMNTSLNIKGEPLLNRMDDDKLAHVKHQLNDDCKSIQGVKNEVVHS